MISCKTARGWILRVHDGELGVEQDLSLQAHLGECGACLRLWRRTVVLEQALAELPEPPVASLDLEQAVGRVRARCEREDASHAGRPRVWRVAAAGAAAAGLVGITLVATSLVPDRGALEPGATASTRGPGRGQHGEEGPLPDPSVPQRGSRARTVRHLERPEPPPVHTLEPERVETSRRQVRAALASAIETHAVLDGVDDFTRAVDGGLEPLARQGWPVTRLVERLVDDPDLALAAAAVRYLGRRGDRLSARCLARQLTAVPRSPRARALRESLVAALEDAGDEGLAALGQAAREPALAADVLRIARTVGGELAVRRTRDVIVARRGLEGGVDELREAAGVLAGLGPPGIDSLIDLGAHGDVPRGTVLDVLSAARGARATLLEYLDRGPDPGEVDFLLAAIGRLEAGEALAWVEARSRDRLHRTAATECLAELGSFEALARLFALRDAGLLRPDEVEPALGRLAARHPERLPAHVHWLEERSDSDGLEAMLAVLLEVGAPWAGRALAALAQSPRLDQDQRVWSALAVGEAGALDGLPRLVELLHALEPGWERLAAACLLSIHALGGRAPAFDALTARGAPPAEVLELLDERARGRSLAAPLYKLARRIEPWLDPENRDPRRMTP